MNCQSMSLNPEPPKLVLPLARKSQGDLDGPEQVNEEAHHEEGLL